MMRHLYKPSELKIFLKERGLDAKKGLSQNFLIDGNIIQKIVDTAAIEEGDWVLEVGPGPGALTEALLERGAQVTAVEMDKGFAEALRQLSHRQENLIVFQRDILEFPLLDFLKKKEEKKWKVVANLPYHITTPILNRFLPLYPAIDTLTLMVQKEFADRMGAKKTTPAYSSFTLFLEFYAKIEKSFTVSPHCFYPRPSVHSAVVHCKLHPPVLSQEVERFFQLTRTAFGKRRKMLRSSLRELYGSEHVEKVLLRLSYPITTRPEELSLEEFIALFSSLNAS